ATGWPWRARNAGSRCSCECRIPPAPTALPAGISAWKARTPCDRPLLAACARLAAASRSSPVRPPPLGGCALAAVPAPPSVLRRCHIPVDGPSAPLPPSHWDGRAAPLSAAPPRSRSPARSAAPPPQPVLPPVLAAPPTPRPAATAAARPVLVHRSLRSSVWTCPAFSGICCSQRLSFSLKRFHPNSTRVRVESRYFSFSGFQLKAGHARPSHPAGKEVGNSPVLGGSVDTSNEGLIQFV